MANYPDWVLKHKQKGTYINKVGNKYYLYAAHSERVKGTDKVRRICDGYIGRITQKDGLIPAHHKEPAKMQGVQSASVLEFGLSYVIYSKTPEILEGLCKTHPKNGSLAYLCSILRYIYGFYSTELYVQSFLHLLIPGVGIPSVLSPSAATAAGRGERMIRDRMQRIFGDDLPLVCAYFSNVRLLYAGGKVFLPEPGVMGAAQQLSEKYGISWREELEQWQKSTIS